MLWISEKVLVVATLYCFVLCDLRLRTLAGRTRGTPYDLSLGARVIYFTNRDLGYNHSRDITATRGACFRSTAEFAGGCLCLLPFFLMCKDQLFMLIEADKVEMQVFDTVLLQQVRSDKTSQVDAGLSQCVVFIKSRIILNRAEIPTIVAHIQWLLLATDRVVQWKWYATVPASSRILTGSCRIIRRWNSSLESFSRTYWLDITILLDDRVRIWSDSFPIRPTVEIRCFFVNRVCVE